MNTLCSKCHRMMLDVDFESRNVEGQRGITEIGLKCPHCDQWYHSYFLNDELRRLQANMSGRKVSRQERRTYQGKFVNLNKRMRRKMGLKVKTIPVAKRKRKRAER